MVVLYVYRLKCLEKESTLTSWISVDKKMPKVGENCWYYFNMVGSHRGQFKGYYEDEDGKMWKGMHIFANDYGFLTGDVTHWHPDQEEIPNDPE